MRIKYIKKAAQTDLSPTFKFPPDRLPPVSFMDREGVYRQAINVDNPNSLRECLNHLSKAEFIGFDVETIGCDPKKQAPINRAKVISLQLSDGKHAYFIPNWGPWSGLIQQFRDLLANPDIAKIAHNAKYDMHSLQNHGIGVGGPIYDTLVMDWLAFNDEMEHDLKSVARRLGFKCTLADFDEVFKEPILKKDGTPSKRDRLIPLDEVVSRGDGWLVTLIDYAVKDPYLCVEVFTELRNRMTATNWVSERNYFEYFETFEMPYTRVLYDIEREGSPVDSDWLKKVEDDFTAQSDRIENELLVWLSDMGLPDEFLSKLNLNSGDQIAAILTHMGISTGKASAKTGKMSVGKEVLEEIDDPRAAPLVEKVLAWRQLKKIISTYCIGLREEARVNRGRVHTVLNQAGTATMRLSSKNPNLQNIPIRTDNGKKIRKAFQAPPGYTMGVIDMSQIQLRLLAHFSGDPVMVKAYQEGWDLHALTAVKAFPKVAAFVGNRELSLDVLEEVKEAFKKDRRDAKDINFGVIFGMGPMKYAQKTGRSEKEGRDAIQGFFDTYPNVRPTIKAVQKAAKDRGYIRTLLRRYVYIRNINSTVPAFRAAAEREAFNYLIQGSEADLMKMAMLCIHRCPKLRALGVVMALQVHDELVLFIPEKSVKEATPLIEEYVSHPYRHFGFRDLKVDTPAELGTSDNWAEAK